MQKRPLFRDSILFAFIAAIPVLLGLALLFFQRTYNSHIFLRQISILWGFAPSIVSGLIFGSESKSLQEWLSVPIITWAYYWVILMAVARYTNLTRKWQLIVGISSAMVGNWLQVYLFVALMILPTLF